MQQTIIFKAPSKPSASPVVILTGPTLRPQLPTLSSRLSRALSMAWSSAKCICTLERTISAASSLCAATAVLAGMESAVSGSMTSQIVMSIAVCLGLPLAITGALLSSKQQKGGKA